MVEEWLAGRLAGDGMGSGRGLVLCAGGGAKEGGFRVAAGGGPGVAAYTQFWQRFSSIPLSNLHPLKNSGAPTPWLCDLAAVGEVGLNPVNLFVVSVLRIR